MPNSAQPPPMPELCLVGAARDVVVAYVSNNSVSDDRLPAMIEAIHASLVKVASGDCVPAMSLTAQVPAVVIRKSITEDYIICLEDGKRLKVLTRYLKTKFCLTPDQYRQKWGLAHDYPMTAPSYSKQRSAMALDMGLGKASKGRTPPSPAA